MTALKSLTSGLAGAAALTVVHETARRVLPHAPRVDVIGRRAIGQSMLAMGRRPPRGQALQGVAMAGDLVSNALYYSLISAGRAEHPWRRATTLGLVGGLGAVYLPSVFGLGDKPVRRTGQTAAMTVAWYVLGALTTAAVTRALQGKR